jgi:hypothetical protein
MKEIPHSYGAFKTEMGSIPAGGEIPFSAFLWSHEWPEGASTYWKYLSSGTALAMGSILLNLHRSAGGVQAYAKGNQQEIRSVSLKWRCLPAPETKWML